MRTENWKKIVAGCGMVLLAAYVGGFFEILFSRSEVCLSPLQCLYAGCGTSSGRKWSMAAVVLLLALTVLVIWRGKDNPLHDERILRFRIRELMERQDLWEHRSKKKYCRQTVEWNM